MVKRIDDKQNELKDLCRRFEVRTFEVFGSAAQNTDLSESSDLDFLVEFLPMTPAQHSEAYFGLLDSLKKLFACDVDLLETGAIDNPYLLESINQNRVTLYAA